MSLMSSGGGSKENREPCGLSGLVRKSQRERRQVQSFALLMLLLLTVAAVTNLPKAVSHALLAHSDGVITVL